MQYGLGGYGDRLTIDDYNAALKAGGSDYSLQEPQLGQSAMGGDSATPNYGAGLGQSAEATQRQQLPMAVQTPGPYDYPEPEKKKKDGSVLGKVLGIVGSVVGGGAGAIIGGAGGLANKE